MSVKTIRIDRGADRVLREVAKLKKNPYIKIGYPKEFGEIKAQKKGEKRPVTVLDVAIYHEYGAPGANLPERSFIRATIKENYRRYFQLNNKLIDKIIHGRMNLRQALNYMGLAITKDIKNYIRKKKVRPESKRAIDTGGTTLWDTGQLINSLGYSIAENGKIAIKGGKP